MKKLKKRKTVKNINLLRVKVEIKCFISTLITQSYQRFASTNKIAICIHCNKIERSNEETVYQFLTQLLSF